MLTNRFWCLRILCLILCLDLGCSRISAPAPQGDGITASPGMLTALDSKVTVYALQQGDNHFSLTASHSKDDRFSPNLQFSASLRDRPDYCPSQIPIGVRFSAFRSLFHHLLGMEPSEQRYVLYVTCYDELDHRLPALALKNGRWRELQKQNAPESVVYPYLGKLLNDGNAFPELNDALKPFPYRAQVDASSLEKLWTARVADLPPQQRQSINVSARDAKSETVPIRISKAFLLTKEN
jgi:hypothetical protein